MQRYEINFNLASNLFFFRTFAHMIFYFSGTGNTRWAAQQLAEATHEQLFFIPDELQKEAHRYEFHEGERLGFCFPTHGWQPPGIVRKFIRQATFNIRPDTYVYAFTTCGDNMGHAMKILSKECKRKGISIHSSFALVMPESNICFPFLHLDAKEKEQEKIHLAKKRILHIINNVRDRKKDIEELVKGAIPYTYTYIIGGFYNKHLITDAKFWVDEEACIQCGLCSRVCPVDDIKGLPPQWNHDGSCTNCLACYHHCPCHAIHWGKMKRGQYTFSSNK